MDKLISLTDAMKIIDDFGYTNCKDSRDYEANSRMDKVRMKIQEIPVAYDKEILAFFKGEWCEAEKVQNALGMTFEQCLGVFDFSRSAEWWSMVGKNKEEKGRNGQKIIAYFRIRRRAQNG